MRDYSELEEVFNQQKIAPEDQEMVRSFLLSFSFDKRQQLMGIFLGFPDKIELFIRLLKMKIEFKKKPTQALAAKILDLENSEIKNLIKQLE